MAERPHITAEGVAGALSAEIGTISLQSVYDALGVLVAKGAHPAHSAAGSPARCPDCVDPAAAPSRSDPLRRARGRKKR